MSKIKIVFYLVLVFIIYKGYVAFKDFEIGVGDRYAEIEERAEFAYEACLVMRQRFHAVEIFEEYGWDIDETINYDESVKVRRDFQEFMFQRVIPSLKRVGLLTESIRPKFEKLGILKWEDFDDEDVSWKEAQSA